MANEHRTSTVVYFIRKQINYLFLYHYIDITFFILGCEELNKQGYHF